MATPWDFVNIWEEHGNDYPTFFWDNGNLTTKKIKVTAPSHGLNNGDVIKIVLVEGMTEVNGNTYIVADKNTDYFYLKSADLTYVNGYGYHTYIRNGQVRKMVQTISGLDHLEGETVSVQTDGDPYAQYLYTVIEGQVYLNELASVIHAGLPYTGTLQFLPLGDGSRTGTGQTKPRKIYLTALRLFKSLGIWIGQDENSLRELTPKDYGFTGQASLFSGDMEKFYGGTWSKNAEPIIKQTRPLPLFILASVIRSEESES